MHSHKMQIHAWAAPLPWINHNSPYLKHTTCTHSVRRPPLNSSSLKHATPAHSVHRPSLNSSLLKHTSRTHSVHRPHLNSSFLKHTSRAHSVHRTRSSQGSNQKRAQGVRALGMPGSSNMLQGPMAHGGRQECGNNKMCMRAQGMPGLSDMPRGMRVSSKAAQGAIKHGARCTVHLHHSKMAAGKVRFLHPPFQMLCRLTSVLP